MIMKTISVSEFRKNIKKYADLASKEKVIVNRGSGKAFTIVPVEEIEDEGYNPEFIKKIQNSLKEAEEGKTVTIKTEKELREFLDSL